MGLLKSIAKNQMRKGVLDEHIHNVAFALLEILAEERESSLLDILERMLENYRLRGMYDDRQTYDFDELRERLPNHNSDYERIVDFIVIVIAVENNLSWDSMMSFQRLAALEVVEEKLIELGFEPHPLSHINFGNM